MRKIIWLILVAVLGSAGWFAWAVSTPTEPSGQVFVMLHPGYSTHRIAAELKSAGIIRSEEAFVLWHYYHHGRSLKAGEYLFNKPSNIIDIASAQALLNVDDVRRLIEQIFAGLEGTAVMVVVPEDEGFLAANDAGAFKFSSDAVRGISGVQHDEHLPGRLGGRRDSPGEPSGAS